MVSPPSKFIFPPKNSEILIRFTGESLFHLYFKEIIINLQKNSPEAIRFFE